jgi:hypothetical protein
LRLPSNIANPISAITGADTVEKGTFFVPTESLGLESLTFCKNAGVSTIGSSSGRDCKKHAQGSIAPHLIHGLLSSV